MQNAKTIGALSSILAVNANNANDVCYGVNYAVHGHNALRSSPEIAKRLLKIYDENAAIEYLAFDDDYFDPLFAIVRLKESLMRLTGYKRSILIIESLSKSSLNGKKRKSPKSELRLRENAAFIESYAEKFEKYIQNLEIIFI